jgi:hypothetical protein
MDPFDRNMTSHAGETACRASKPLTALNRGCLAGVGANLSIERTDARSRSERASGAHVER